MLKMFTSAVAALALSASAALSADMVQIKTEAEFRKVIVDKKLATDWGEMLYNADNQTGGTYKGRKISGIWSWIDGTVCQPLYLDGKYIVSDCRTVAVKGNSVTITRKAGKGTSYSLTITGE